MNRGDEALQSIRDKGYKIERFLGQGGFGGVWLVSKDQNQWAAKVVQMPVQPAQRERVQQEVLLHLQLAHANIVKLERYWSSSRSLVLLLEYIPGGTLEDAIEDLHRQGSPVREDWLWSIITDVATALAYLAEQSMIHRDLKPANILLRADGSCVLADFGLSRLLNHGELARTRCGTAIYQAPEQIGQGGYTPAVDVWMLGVTIMEAASGAPPFLNREGRLDLDALQRLTPTLPSRYTSELRVLVRSMLNKQPTARPRPKDIIATPGVEVAEKRREITELQIRLNDALAAERAAQDTIAQQGRDIAALQQQLHELRLGSAIGFARLARLEDERKVKELAGATSAHEAQTDSAATSADGAKGFTVAGTAASQGPTELKPERRLLEVLQRSGQPLMRSQLIAMLGPDTIALIGSKNETRVQLEKRISRMLATLHTDGLIKKEGKLWQAL
ncbi:hypothetical protein OC835_007312 [Tilletia horrida]|nr:hypothetical protein OC835_007312 [Tilletia horrida]